MDLNQLIEQIIALHDRGGNPNQMFQQMVLGNNNINQMATQFQNMKQGRSNTEVLMQLARQGGVSEKNLQGLARILGAK